jgi:hypothetical protein
VWLDEAPPAAYIGRSVVTTVVEPTRRVDAARRIAGVELCVPHGGRMSYALLGAELVGAEGNSLDVIVSVNNAGDAYPSSIPMASDRVFVGLPDEYAGAVLSGVTSVARTRGAPVGMVLRVQWAAHAVVSSSPRAFEQVGGLVIQVLTLPHGATDDQVRALFG